MGRYLCQLCWSIVQYGERHPCFFYKDEEEVYTVPPPNKPEETEGKDEETDGTPTGYFNDNNGNPFAEAEQSHIEGSNETLSLPTEHNTHISVMPASRRKGRPTLKQSKFLPEAKNEPSDSKSASSTNIVKEGIKNAQKKSKNDRQIESAYSVAPQIGKCSSSEMATETVDLGSVAGPSGTQTKSNKTPKAKLLVCDVCGKASDTRQHFQAHMRTHTGEKPFVCSTCGRQFTQQAHLTTDILTHKEEKPHICPFCSKRFSQKQHLVDHLNIHTGEKPYKCKFCDKCFANKSNCNRHEKKEHGGV